MPSENAQQRPDPVRTTSTPLQAVLGPDEAGMQPLWIWLSLGLLSLTIALSTGYLLDRLYRINLERQREVAQLQAAALEAHLSQSLDLLQLTLADLAGKLPLASLTTSISQVWRDQAYTALGRNPQVRSLILVGPEDRVLLAVPEHQQGRVVDRQTFIPQGDQPLDLLRVGPVWVGRDFRDAHVETAEDRPDSGLSGRFLALGLDVKQGRSGPHLLVAGLSLDHLLRHFERHLAPYGASADLMDLNGRLLATTHPGPNPTSLAPEALTRLFDQHRTGLLAVADALHPTHDSAYQVSARHPFAVVVHMDRQRGLSAWRDEAGLTVGLAGAGLTLLLVLGLVHGRRSSRARHLHTTALARLQLAASVFETSRDGIMISDAHNRILEVNAAFTQITGYTPDEVLGQSPKLLKSGLQNAQFYAEMWERLNQDGEWQGEIWNRRKNGDIYPEHLSITTLRNADGWLTHHVAVMTDLSTLKHHKAELERLAHNDPLTGLPNRRLLLDRLHQSLLQTRSAGKLLAVVALDLDGFKAINDSLGHAAGDQLLKALAQRLSQTLRQGDTVARTGGDEFVLVLHSVDGLHECRVVLERLQRTIAAPTLLGPQAVAVSASLGVTLYPDDASDPDTLLRHADKALYDAKASGKNRCHFFDAAHDRAMRAQHQALLRLDQALAQQELCLFYQPKVNLHSGQVIGVEALIRWQHPERGLLAPGQFMPAVEGSELEVALGFWVMDTALSQISLWRQQGLPLVVSVNLSARLLVLPDFPQRLQQALAEHPDLAPADLELEILESAAVDDWEAAIRALAACQALGLRFALDDFGTGYSSLLQLRRLPVQTLKIDQGFVRGMLTEANDLAIVESVVRLSQTFDLTVIAEGVETPAQAARLLALGCRLGQGYGIAPPLAAAELPDWLRHWTTQGFWRQLPQT